MFVCIYLLDVQYTDMTNYYTDICISQYLFSIVVKVCVNVWVTAILPVAHLFLLSRMNTTEQ